MTLPLCDIQPAIHPKPWSKPTGTLFLPCPQGLEHQTYLLIALRFLSRATRLRVFALLSSPKARYYRAYPKQCFVACGSSCLLRPAKKVASVVWTASCSVVGQSCAKHIGLLLVALQHRVVLVLLQCRLPRLKPHSKCPPRTTISMTVGLPSTSRLTRLNSVGCPFRKRNTLTQACPRIDHEVLEHSITLNFHNPQSL